MLGPVRLCVSSALVLGPCLVASSVQGILCRRGGVGVCNVLSNVCGASCVTLCGGVPYQRWWFWRPLQGVEAVSLRQLCARRMRRSW